MKNRNNKEEIIKIIILSLIVAFLIIFAIILHKNYDFNLEKRNMIINADDFQIEGLEENKIQQIHGIDGIYYYEMEDYGDFQLD